MAEDYVDGYDCTLIFCGNIKHGSGYNDILLGKDS